MPRPGSGGALEADLELGDAARLARQGDPAAVLLDNPLGDREAKPGAARCLSAAVAAAVEAVEDVGQVLARDAVAALSTRSTASSPSARS